MLPDGYDSDLLVVCYGHNSLQTGKNLVFHFSAQVYKIFDALEKIIMVPTNCTSSKITVLETDDSDFALPEQFHICRDIMHRNLVGDSDVRILTPILFTSKNSYLTIVVQTCRKIFLMVHLSSSTYRVWRDVAFNDFFPYLTVSRFQKRCFSVVQTPWIVRRNSMLNKALLVVIQEQYTKRFPDNSTYPDYMGRRDIRISVKSR